MTAATPAAVSRSCTYLRIPPGNNGFRAAIVRVQLAAWRQSTEINHAPAPAEPEHFARAFWHNGALTNRRPRRPTAARIGCEQQKLPPRQVSCRVRVDRRHGCGPRAPGRGRRCPDRALGDRMRPDLVVRRSITWGAEWRRSEPVNAAR